MDHAIETLPPQLAMDRRCRKKWNVFGPRDSINEKKKKLEKRKQFLQISIQSLVYSLVDIQRGLQNGEWNPEELERNEQILQDAADDALFYCDYFSKLLAIDGWRRRDVNH
jgi:hypothetical protein